jgi:hypothetical protein
MERSNEKHGPANSAPVTVLRLRVAHSQKAADEPRDESSDFPALPIPTMDSFRGSNTSYSMRRTRSHTPVDRGMRVTLIA